MMKALISSILGLAVLSGCVTMMTGPDKEQTVTIVPSKDHSFEIVQVLQGGGGDVSVLRASERSSVRMNRTSIYKITFYNDTNEVVKVVEAKAGIPIYFWGNIVLWPGLLVDMVMNGWVSFDVTIEEEKK